MLRSKPAVCLASLCLILFAGHANGSIIVYGTHTDHPVALGGSLTDVRMSVELAVSGGTATFTFTNDSAPPENSAVFKTIFIDPKDDDTGTDILWDPNVRNDLSDGTYSLGSYNVLPGYGPVIQDGGSMIELNADSPAPHKGIAPGGNRLVVEFSTSLADGSDIDDYLAAFNGGGDTFVYSLGFHAISADTVDGESLSGIYVPEPSALALIVLGATVLAYRRRRRARK